MNVVDFSNLRSLYQKCEPSPSRMHFSSCIHTSYHYMFGQCLLYFVSTISLFITSTRAYDIRTGRSYSKHKLYHSQAIFQPHYTYYIARPFISPPEPPCQLSVLALPTSFSVSTSQEPQRNPARGSRADIIVPAEPLRLTKSILPSLAMPLPRHVLLGMNPWLTGPGGNPRPTA